MRSLSRSLTTRNYVSLPIATQTLDPLLPLPLLSASPSSLISLALVPTRDSAVSLSKPEHRAETLPLLSLSEDRAPTASFRNPPHKKKIGQSTSYLVVLFTVLAYGIVNNMDKPLKWCNCNGVIKSQGAKCTIPDEFDIFTLRGAGFYMNARGLGGVLQHKDYCAKHSTEQKEADDQQYGPEEIKCLKQTRVELEKLRLLCEQIIKREKLKVLEII
ncbi:hypothetical protein FCM35_KLT11959 [Carex littledalei]|uniref:Uncharacterized protein n=1 Tax=Carex littledalei TaxID=544730 RepID=A0A833QPD9_9POAL|nr:hypothetical protein FCM35_KLT11959 [Carex littledalei]